MAKTRRQKATVAATAESATREPTPTSPSQPPVQAALTVNIPEDLDFDFLSSLLPDTRLDSPSPETILHLYRLIVTQATESDAAQRELEEAKADIEKKDVELDQALQDRESATKELEETLQGVQKELEQVKQENEEITVARAALQAQLTTISTSQSTSSAELESLKHRVEDTEREKRDLIGIVSRLKEDATQREEEIKTLRANLKQVRQEQQTFEAQVRELRSTETSTKFKVESLTQQLTLAKDEASRSSADLASKSEEFAQYRRTRHAEFAQLQAAHDSLVQTHAATESSLKALQSAHNAQTHQLTQALGQVQDLKGQLAEQEATYSSEAAGLKRLVEMMEEREAQAKQIVESIEKEWAGVGDRAERREAVLREEIEAQRQRAEEAEKRVEDMQKVMDRMDRGEFPVPGATPGSVPVTPVRGGTSPGMYGSPDFLNQSMYGLSPTIAMASKVQKSGKTFTEVYSEYVKLQEEMARKTKEYDQMEETLTKVLNELEDRAPLINQQRDEYARMQNEASLLATQLTQTLAERDANAASSAENAQKLAKTTRENELLNKQLNDLGRQVQALLKELGRRQDPSIPTDDELEADEGTRPAENIEDVITNNLVLFRSIPALQEQNQKLLKIVRELGEKMEAEEKEYREQLEAEQAAALQEAYAAIKELQQQLENNKKHSETTIQAYLKERDALKSMLARERDAAANGVNGRAEGASGADANKELEEITSHFEVYKTEMGADSGKLREELLNVRHESAQVSAQLAKANAKIEYLSERHRMLQEQNTMQNRDLDNLSMRNQELIDKYARIDLHCGQLSAELVGANAVIDQLRNETANLRAEKQIWQNVESRLIEENKNLAVERSHLADLMANVQKMHNDLERAGENDRKRLETQIQMLENQSQDLRTQLNKERDDVRHISLQKDLELKELRTRIDKTSEEYAKTREALVSAQTSKTHLEEQIERLSRQLQGDEEKLAVYERRATGTSSAEHAVIVSSEQQLESEVAELRSRLKVAEVDLATARSHVQQFQEISQANEAALAALNATYDEYKASTEGQIAKHESEYNALQEKLQSVQQELQTLTAKNAELQRTFETERAAWTQDKKTLEDTIVDLTTSEQSTESERAAHANEIRQLEGRAKTAEDRYGREVLSHAESIQAVEKLRQQLTKAQAAARNNLTAAETAQAKLSASEASWKQQREALDKEMADLTARCKDLAEQNSILHQHLESVSSQAARIRQAADSSATPPTGETEFSEDAETKLAELRSVVAYLRKEKEIVDLQLELSKQENTRLRTQIEHLSASLEDTRKTLSEERERAVEAAASEAQQAQLVERINQLNVLRESNATLRTDCETHAKRARNLETRLQQLSSELEPTKEQLRVAKAELEARDEQVKRLEEESRRWQERNAQLLTKYDRIDPAEVQALKDQIEQLSAAKAALELITSSRESTDTQKIAELEHRIRELKETGKKNNDISKRRFEQDRHEKEELRKQISELEQQLQAITAERDELKGTADSSSQVEELTKQLQTVREEKADLERRLQDAQAAAPVSSAGETEREALLAQLTQERDSLLAEKAAWQASSGTPEGAQKQWDEEKAKLTKARDDAVAHGKRALDRVHVLATELKELRATHAKLSSQLQELEKAQIAEKERAAAEQEAAVKAAVEKVKSEMPASSNPEDTSRQAEALKALENRLIKQHQEELKKAVDAAKASGSNGAVASTESAKAAIEEAVAARERELKAIHDQEIAQAVERGRMEAAAKGKLKDAQLVRTQTRLKELEGQVEELKKAGVVIPPPSSSASGSKLAPSPSTSSLKSAPGGASNAPAPAAQAAAKPPTAPAANTQHKPPTAPAKLAGAAALPQRPTHHVPPQGAGRGRGGPVRGRGGLSIRGAAPAAAGAHETTPAEGGVSIIGAAGKRAREDGEASGDDSLAKRLKPGPVPIRRDRVHTPTTGP